MLRYFRTSPPSPLSNFAASPLRGEGEPDKPQRSFPPLHAALLRNAELERGLGGEVRKGCDFLMDTLLGDVHKVRVFKEARSTEEKSVTIQEGGVTPNLVDLNEALPVAAGPSTKKNKPLVFGDIDE